jgi:hypothetical protein
VPARVRTVKAHHAGKGHICSPGLRSSPRACPSSRISPLHRSTRSRKASSPMSCGQRRGERYWRSGWTGARSGTRSSAMPRAVHTAEVLPVDPGSPRRLARPPQPPGDQPHAVPGGRLHPGHACHEGQRCGCACSAVRSGELPAGPRPGRRRDEGRHEGAPHRLAEDVTCEALCPAEARRKAARSIRGMTCATCSRGGTLAGARCGNGIGSSIPASA